MSNYDVIIKRYNGSSWDNIYPKTTAGNIISGVLDPARIPGLNASKITSGTLDVDRIPDLDASKISSGEIYIDRIPPLPASRIATGVFHVDRIPNLDADKITSGAFDEERIPFLPAAKINSGTFSAARIPNLSATKITSDTFDADRIPDLDASKITTGQIDAARLPAVALTNVRVSTTLENFLATYTGYEMQEGDVLTLTVDKQTYIHNGGTTGTASDFTLLETPTDSVISVAGKTGVVTLNKNDVGLGNVDNTSDMDKPVSTAQAAALATKVDKNPAITGATKTKITYDSKGLVTGGADLDADDIPSLPASKITSGTFNAARIPTLPISKITGLQSVLDSKQRDIYLITTSTIPDEFDNGDIIFHAV